MNLLKKNLKVDQAPTQQDLMFTTQQMNTVSEFNNHQTRNLNASNTTLVV